MNALREKQAKCWLSNCWSFRSVENPEFRELMAAATLGKYPTISVRTLGRDISRLFERTENKFARFMQVGGKL